MIPAITCWLLSENLEPGEGRVRYGAESCTVAQPVPIKHKMSLVDLKPGDLVYLYGMVVAEAVEAIPRGGVISTRTVKHRAGAYTAERKPAAFALPDPAPWADRTFMGYRRANGLVGTRNYWLVIPLVFCENRNVGRMKEALEEELGYGTGNKYREHVRQLVANQANGRASQNGAAHPHAERVFRNLDGIRFLTHEGGCGGTRQDAQALCGLLAGYIHHPNVAGASVLSLGCQNAQPAMLLDELRARDPKMTKPVLVFEHQRSGRDTVLMTEALDATFAALVEANNAERAPAPLSALNIGAAMWRVRRLQQRHLGEPDRGIRFGCCRRRGRNNSAFGVS